MRRDELTDRGWSVIHPLSPRNCRGVPRADDRRVINGIPWRFRTDSPWRDVPERYGPRTYDGDIVMIDSSCVRVHHDGSAVRKGGLPILAWDVREAG